MQILGYDRKSIKQNLLSLENIYLRNPEYIICGYITDEEITALFYVYYKNQETFHLEVYNRKFQVQKREKSLFLGFTFAAGFPIFTGRTLYLVTWGKWKY